MNIVCTDGDELDLALSLLAPGGLYVIDDMLPQPNWPAGHDAQVQLLMEDLARRPQLQLCSLPWPCGVVIATQC